MLSIPQPLRLREPALKPETLTIVQRWHLRAQPQVSLPFRLTSYVPSVHGLDALVHLWAAIPSAAERVATFGEIAASPISFVQSYATTAEFIIVHRDDLAWTLGQGLLGVVWLDDIVEGARARVHHYVFPAYRHPVTTKRFAAAVLCYLFGTRGFQVLYGLTPACRREAVRLALRVGFERIGVIEHAFTEQGALVDGVVTVLTRERWGRMP